MSVHNPTANDSSSVLVIGSINTDLVLRVPSLPDPGETILSNGFTQYAGGKGANQAVAAARLGARVSMVGSLGSDSFGDTALAGLKAETIDCRHICRDPLTPSGIALIHVADSGENQITVAAGANLTLPAEAIEKAIAETASETLLLIQLEIPLPLVKLAVKLAATKGIRVILDPAPAQQLDADLLKNLFLLTPNQTEAEKLLGLKIDSNTAAFSAARLLFEHGVENVVLTLGEKGAVVLNNRIESLIAPPPVKPVDTTAAGDCFNGALAFALAKNVDLQEAVEFASHAAAVAVTRAGAQNSLPTLEDIDSLNNLFA